MPESLQAVLRRFEDLERQLADPAVARDPRVCATLAKEHGRLAKVVGPIRDYEAVHAKRLEAERVLSEGGLDPDLTELARDEAAALAADEKARLVRLADLLARDEKDDLTSCLVEIRAGTGGEEAALFARDLFQMYAKHAERRGWRLEVMDASPTDLGGFREVIFALSGPEVYRLMRHESGGHRVQRVPVTEAGGRKHTSAVTVAVLPEVEDVEVDLKREDLEIERIRSSGPGGQNVNKVSSAIRLTHKPTGLVVHCQDEQSQHKNLAKAMRVLRSRLYDLQQQAQKADRDQSRRSQIGSGDRSERIRTYNFHDNRVTDHRVNLTIHDLGSVMEGRLEPLLEALLESERAERLKAL